ncbi:hypothetical protein E2562_016850 [Oryza meyeriana var. granulata]|uniref:Uncharacterized protein n=1 Tax=Oryza meyeriana var. granulata TaxID=110450 RepID=A0A6G1BYU7_9ORYZ|nr:hypothetical protein E2562_016850 [Oryza meyeriana var. granulata]
MVLHGLDKVVMTKDHGIMTNGAPEVCQTGMLENIEISEQNQRCEPYKSTKKEGMHDVNGSVMIHCLGNLYFHHVYDDLGLALDEAGNFNVDTEKKLGEGKRNPFGRRNSLIQMRLNQNLLLLDWEQRHASEKQEIWRHLSPSKMKHARCLNVNQGNDMFSPAFSFAEKTRAQALSKTPYLVKWQCKLKVCSEHTSNIQFMCFDLLLILVCRYEVS